MDYKPGLTMKHEPIRLDACTVVLDIEKAISAHAVMAENPNKRFDGYRERLGKLKALRERSLNDDKRSSVNDNGID